MVLISSGCFGTHLGASWTYQKMEILLSWATCPGVPTLLVKERNNQINPYWKFLCFSLCPLPFCFHTEKAGPILQSGSWGLQSLSLFFLPGWAGPALSAPSCMSCSTVCSGFAGQWQNSEKHKVLPFSMHLICENSESLKRTFGCSVKCFN